MEINISKLLPPERGNNDAYFEKKNEMRVWLIENVGHAKRVTGNDGVGWTMVCRLSNSKPANIEWVVNIDDDTLSVAFKLRFS